MNDFYEDELRYIKEYTKNMCNKVPYNTHHWDHIFRVTNMSRKLGLQLKANMLVVETSAVLHDIGRLNKDKSTCHAELSEEFARNFLISRDWDIKLIEPICYAIKSHRYNTQIIPLTLEGKILQDADKLDALGAIGIIRVVSHITENNLYSLEDPFCESRTPLKEFTLDHFYEKILKLKDSMHTEQAMEIALQRHKFLKNFILQLKNEL